MPVIRLLSVPNDVGLRLLRLTRKVREAIEKKRTRTENLRNKTFFR